VTLARNS